MALVTFASIAGAVSAAPAWACSTGDGCDETYRAILTDQNVGQQSPTPGGEAAAAQASKPLQLVTRKASLHRKSRTARKSVAAEDQAVKNANAQARESDIGKAEAKTESKPTEIKTTEEAGHDRKTATEKIGTETDLKSGYAPEQQDDNLTEADRLAAPTMPILAADQINEIDEAAPATPQAAQAATAPVIDPAQPAQESLAAARVEQGESVTAAPNDSGTWDKTSLIGKIFIAAGGLLTAASAIRMFVG
jgi:hypothetical protein